MPLSRSRMSIGRWLRESRSTRRSSMARRRLRWRHLSRRFVFATGFLLFCAGSWLLVPQLGQDFFPAVDAGQFRLHLRARSGTRIEESVRLVEQVEDAIRNEIPPDELAGILDNIGIPNSGISLSYS